MVHQYEIELTKKTLKEITKIKSEGKIISLRKKWWKHLNINRDDKEAQDLKVKHLKQNTRAVFNII